MGGPPDKIISIDNLVEGIKNHELQERIKRLHSYKYKSDEYNRLKSGLPCITPAGVFSGGRGVDDIFQVSDYLYFDIDASDIETDIVSVKEQLLSKYSDLITLMGTSVGGRGIFFYVKVSGLTKENYCQVREYFLQEVFRGVPLDKQAGGVNRAHVIPFDPCVYFNNTVCSIVPKDLISVKEKGTFRIKVSNQSRYTRSVSFMPIDQVLKSLRLQTEVDVTDAVFRIEPIDYVKVFIPKVIQNGKKHKAFRAMTQAILCLNPDADLFTIQSFINYVNQNHTTQPMRMEEMCRTVEHAYGLVKETGEIGIRTKVKSLHFNKQAQISSKEKSDLAAKINGMLKTLKSVLLIQRAIKELTEKGIKVSKKAVAESGGLSTKTVSRNWEKNPEEIVEQIYSLNQVA